MFYSVFNGTLREKELVVCLKTEFSDRLRGVRLLPLCAAPESRGAYHVADIDICDCFDSSFRCPAVLPDGYYSDLREVNILHSKVFASRKFTKG